ncbi:hypothetical protein EJB05_10164, partial [Eragrostis curvula]
MGFYFGGGSVPTSPESFPAAAVPALTMPHFGPRFSHRTGSIWEPVLPDLLTAATQVAPQGSDSEPTFCTPMRRPNLVSSSGAVLVANSSILLQSFCLDIFAGTSKLNLERGVANRVSRYLIIGILVLPC